MLTDNFRDPGHGARQTAARDDARLVREIAEGSEAALRPIYETYASAVFAISFRVTGNRSEAEEVVQETFLALWRRPELFDPERAALGTWLLTVARNRAIDRVRASERGRRAEVFSSLAEGDSYEADTVDRILASGRLIGASGGEPGPEQVLASRETLGAVAAALATLDHPERQVIVLAYRDELTHAEIAQRLSWPLGTVKTRTRRALRHLRAALDATPRQQRVRRRPASETGFRSPCWG